MLAPLVKAHLLPKAISGPVSCQSRLLQPLLLRELELRALEPAAAPEDSDSLSVALELCLHNYGSLPGAPEERANARVSPCAPACQATGSIDDSVH